MRKLRFGSRDSQLSVRQSQLIIEAVTRAHPEVEAELVTMKTTGDKILDRTLEQIGGKGLFVRELDQALLDRRVDFTIHSLKDLPVELPPELPLVAFSRREDPRDALVLPEGQTELDFSRPIGCASRRRQLQLQALFPQAVIAPVRGNVLTRLSKLDGGQYSALVLAAAGLRRLGLSDRIARYFTVEEILPAAGQGIIAVQGRADMDCSEILAVSDPDAAVCAQAERAFVRWLDGGCTSPVAAHAQVDHGRLTLTGLYVSEDETIVRRGSLSGAAEDAERLGTSLARELKEGRV